MIFQTHSQPAAPQLPNVTPAAPPPAVQNVPKQPATDLLGDLGGDPFAQPAGTVQCLTSFEC